MKYRNRVEEGMQKEASIQDEIVVAIIVFKRRQKHMKHRIRCRFRFICINISFSIGMYESLNSFSLDGDKP